MVAQVPPHGQFSQPHLTLETALRISGNNSRFQALVALGVHAIHLRLLRPQLLQVLLQALPDVGQHGSLQRQAALAISGNLSRSLRETEFADSPYQKDREAANQKASNSEDPAGRKGE